MYLGMSLVPAVTELMLAELLYLQYDNPTRPIYMYINSTGVAVSGARCLWLPCVEGEACTPRAARVCVHIPSLCACN